MTEPMKGLTIYEAESLRPARELIKRKPEAVLHYLSGGSNESTAKVLVALGLSALLEVTKQELAVMQMVAAVSEMLVKEQRATKGERHDTTT